MRITVAAVGKIKEKYLTEGIGEFSKRIAPYARLQIAEIGEEKMPLNPSPAQKQKTLALEGERLLKKVPPGSYLIALDVAGKPVSSEELAAKLAALGLAGDSHVAFLIGGAFGLSDGVRAAAKERLSFSRMTFTHQMIRLLLLEQIYRAFKINAGEPYHL